MRMGYRGVSAGRLLLCFVVAIASSRALAAKKAAPKKAVEVSTVKPVTTANAEPADNRLTLEKFEGVNNEADLVAHGWKGGQEKDGKFDHSIQKENGTTFLRESYIVGSEALYRYKEVEWDVNVYPYVTWRWRARQFPARAKVLDSKVSDAAAQVYMLWKKGRRSFVIKYFWSAGDQPGDVMKQSSFIFGSLYGLVLRNNTTPIEWVRETRNVREDYRLAFGDYPTTNARGIGVLSDGDETKSASEADFADFEAMKQLP